jgi:phosphoketolase
VIVSDKQLHHQYLNIDAAIEHCTKGIGIWDWASNDHGCEPDLVMLIHRLSYGRRNKTLHVRGYKERGNINTPMELANDNEIDRFSLAIDAIDRVPQTPAAWRLTKHRRKSQVSGQVKACR